MKTLILTLILLSSNLYSQSNSKKFNENNFEVKAKVDKRVELLTIIARLAEFDEYCSTPLIKYGRDIDDFFKGHKNHKVVSIFKQLREEQGLGYDAVMSMAVHLNPPPTLTPKVEITIDVLDNRWGNNEIIQEFLQQLQDFYNTTNCELFFKQQSQLYTTSEQRFQTLLNKVDFGWYQKFYGELPNGTFNLFIRLHSKGSYGASVTLPNGSKDIYAILSTSEADETGLPVYGENRLGTIIHEFNHSFINHLFFQNIAKFETSGKIIFDKVSGQLKKFGYGNWESTVIESLANAAEARYLFDAETDDKLARKNLLIDQHRGFYWIDELVDLLGAYNQNRNIYPTFSSFFPFFIGYFNDLANRIDDELVEFDYLRPHILALEPFDNNFQSVSPKTKELKLVFDKPLKNIPENLLDKIKKGEHQLPTIKSFDLNSTRTILYLEIELEPNQQYNFNLPSVLFVSDRGYQLNDFDVSFKTANN
tara:strand:+ start:43468 stop:44901 length:1434 start_codon:yes stop_codon:yes gene_type:complete